jgi:DNA-binding winged helix-turn-helix (wHTH) protein
MPLPPSNREARLLRFGVFEVDLDAGELRKNGARIRLQEQPFQVLVALLQNAGQVVTRDHLREKIWPADTFVDFDHSLNTAVNKIRESLGDSASSPRFVETLARRGYPRLGRERRGASRSFLSECAGQ